MISEAMEQDNFTLYFTNHEKRLESFIIQEKAKGEKFPAVFRHETE